MTHGFRTHSCLGMAVVTALMTLVAHVGPACAAGTEDRMDEYRVKAALIVNFAKFVQWSHEAPITICVAGEAPGFEEALAKGRDIVPRPVGLRDDVSRCDVLFVSASIGRNTADLLTRIASTPVLTIGEIDPFINDGGIVRFFLEANRIRFQINAKAADGHGIRISSQLLSLAAR